MKNEQLTIKTSFGEININSNLAGTLNAYIDAIVKYNQDVVIMFDGAEGAGKSTLMRQVGAYCQWYLHKAHKINIPFSVDNIHFNLDDYIKAAIDNDKQKGFIHILDESRAVANRKRSTSSGNLSFTNFLSECRSSGHIHLVALPAFHDLDSYIAIHRCQFLVNIRKFFRQSGKTEQGVPIFELVLGTYRVFINDNTLKAMYFHKMRYIYPKKAVFVGQFDNNDVININDYEEKKRLERAKKFLDEKKESSDKSLPTKSDLAHAFWKHNPNARHKDCVEALGVSHTISKQGKGRALGE